MKILYVSSLVSDDCFVQALNRGATTDFSGQKYHGLFVRGLIKNIGDNNVTALSFPPFYVAFRKLKERNDSINYRYVPILPVPLVKQLFSFIYALMYTLYWCIKSIGQDRVIISSFMRIYQFPAIQLGSFLFKHTSITVVCDIPWLTITQVSAKPLSVKQKMAIGLGKLLSDSFDGYVFLTETMNNVINGKNKPFIVVEGFCDQQMSSRSNELSRKNKKRVILYAGGLSVKYGIQNLVDAVQKIEEDDVELWLYGSGDMSEMLVSEHDCRIHYWGAKSNKEVVEAELQATVLINPRPTTDEYTRYSFPSKTLEYMVSGTYTMTTRLAGIPDEYYKYCGIVEPFDAEGIWYSLKRALSLSNQELHDKGMAAKRFVLENKNNIKQTKRVIDFARAIKRLS